MSATDWTEIPGRLKEAGYAVLYARISYEPDHPLWCAKASSDGREWSALGESLCSAFLELEKQTHETRWRLAESAGEIYGARTG
jgi:hypothetical protein